MQLKRTGDSSHKQLRIDYSLHNIERDKKDSGMFGHCMEQGRRQWKCSKPEIFGIVLGEEGDGLAFPASPPRAPNTMYVGNGATREVEVDNEIYALKVHSAAQKLSAD